MYRLYLKILISCLIGSFVGCSDNQQKKYENEVVELIGKTILFPDSFQSIDKDVMNLPNTDFTIIAYFNSNDCSSCRMKFTQWLDFMKRLDSISDKNVSLLFITDSTDVINIKNHAQKNNFGYPIINDFNGSFAQMNNLSHDSNLQTFLLDKDHKILIVGNPTTSKSIEKLYLKVINPTEQNNIGFNEEPIADFDFGQIMQNQEVSHTFHQINSTADTLEVRKIITSCECTQAYVSPQKITPGEQYSITVIFKDSIIGDFTRSVILQYKGKYPDNTFEISGIIINQ